MKKRNNSEYFASFATRQFSTLTTISGHLKGNASHKNTQCYMLCVYFNLSVYITRDFSAYHLQLEWLFFFSAHPYIENTTL